MIKNNFLYFKSAIISSNIVRQPTHMSVINFETKLFEIGSKVIFYLPPEESAKLPSRGITMVKGTINKVPFKTLLEPDGRYGPGLKPSHWFSPDKKLLAEAQAKVGDSVQVTLEPTKEWVEPEVPDDMKNALNTSATAQNLWNDITPIARWDWIRWVRAVKTDATREKHIEIMLSKLNKGMRRPCCFNRSLCSDPSVSHNWVLIQPSSS